VLQLLCAWLGAAAFVTSLAYFLFAYFVTFDETTALTDATAGQAAAVALNVALFTGFALHHSLFARIGLKNVVRRIFPPALERSLYTWVASLLFLVVCLAWRPLSGVVYHVPAPWSALGYALQLGGIVVTFYGSRALDVLELAGVRQVLNARRPQTAAHAVPLQTGGMYGFVRHPVYFGWLLIVFGAPQMTMTRFVFAVVSSLYLAVAVPFEERSLVGTFGDAYADYKRQVRWRMLPYVY
jgi:methanethiol S-methyltransferase